MNKALFIFSLLASSFLLLTKYYFFFHESLQNQSILFSVELFVITAFVALACISFFKNVSTNFTFTVDKKMVYLLIFVGLFSALSLYGNIQKKSLDWDAIALYDARAIFLQHDMTFTQMSKLGDYDFKNKYYYLLYPPFTSIIHYLWYQNISPRYVGVLYSGVFFCFFSLLSYFLYKKLGFWMAVFCLSFILFDGVLFTTSLIFYTNLPYSFFLFLSILLLNQYIETKQNWTVLFGALLLYGSLWIRFLEPIWFAIIVAFFLQNARKNSFKTAVFTSSVLLTLCILGTRSWDTFLYSVAHNEKIIKESFIVYLEPVVGIFTGSYSAVLISFLKMWKHFILLFILLLFPISIKKKNYEMSFFSSIILFSFLLYFSGLYFISFQFEWWPELGGSLVRSSSFLTPFIFYVIFRKIAIIIGKE